MASMSPLVKSRFAPGNLTLFLGVVSYIGQTMTVLACSFLEELPLKVTDKTHLPENSRMGCFSGDISLRYGCHLVTALVLCSFFLLSIPHLSNAHVLKTCGFDSIYQLVIRHQTRKSIRKPLHLCQLGFFRAESVTPSTLVDALMEADN
ncbi:hypothetical protein POTOM_020427 [Populus tomentosa]|uniref:Uncharacterized protein n=1 Tax=Populus tomentosa TaxID=118781 RepID=A0A8X7ZKQ5_POPTO|nr:hypothetical protein POTOM_020427 [Populus tomentosa]